MANIITGFEPVKSENLLTGSSGGGDGGILNNTDPYLKPMSSGAGIVDVIRNFSWYSGGSTQMQENAIRKTPQVFLVEREQLLSSLLTQALYYANTIKTSTTSIGGGEEQDSFFKKVTNLIGLSEGELFNKLSGVVNRAFSALTEGQDSALLTANKLKSLIGIYLTEPTGYKYVLPYFENPPSIQNSWSGTAEENAPGFISTVSEEVAGFADSAAKAVNLTQPGVFIQKAKSYKVNEQGQSVTVKFPLFNTVKRGNDIPYQQNYELLWLLIYQNKPFKTSFTRVRPPKLYSVTIPGMVSMPYAEINRLEVNFVGTTRNKTVNIGGKSFETPIPDAYEVTIEITSLLADYANTMMGDGFMTSVSEDRIKIGDITGVSEGDVRGIINNTIDSIL